MDSKTRHRLLAYLAEFLGTALLVLIGLSFVILDFSARSPVPRWIPNSGLRRFLTGALFGGTRATIAVSPLGKLSGAHINPAVSLAFYLEGKLSGSDLLIYLLAQCGGAVAGSALLLLWGSWGAPLHFGASLPGPGVAPALAAAAELGCTFLMVLGMLILLSHRASQRFTPLLFPALFALLVWLEAPISGTSANPARSLGPALVSGDWRAQWVYWVGPPLGAALAVALLRSEALGRHRVKVAKLFHFAHDPVGMFSGGR